MEQFAQGLARFRTEAFPAQKSLYQKLATEGQAPKAMVISCSDSRVIPEVITSSDPGQMFVCRNAGNVVPSFGHEEGGVSAAIEYAVVGFGVEHIVVCGHTDCGAMKAVLNRDAVKAMPTVAAWLDHCQCAHGVFRRLHADKVSDKEAARVLAMENVVSQLVHLRTHPSVAAKLATGEIELHGWLFDIEAGQILALDADAREFRPIEDGAALDRDQRTAHHRHHMIAAE